MTRRNKDLGDWGELQASKFLERHGFEIVERNYFTPTGEIDIVAKKGGDYYFVEVKTRREAELANDLSITYFKKHRLQKTVKSYCFYRKIGDASLILAGLIISANRATGKVWFRFVVLL